MSERTLRGKVAIVGVGETEYYKHGIVVLVELPRAGGVRMIGNLLGDPRQAVAIGSEVEAVFEPHDEARLAYTLVQWRYIERSG